MTASQLPIEQPVGSTSAGEPTVDEPQEDRRRRRKAILLLLLLAFLVFLIALTIWYLLFRQPINPLPVIPQANLPTYSTSLYGVDQPIGVAADPAGDRIYITEGVSPFGALIFDGDGKRIGTLQAPADGANHVFVYLAIDPLTQELYVTDRLTGSILIYDASGRYQRTYKPAIPIPGWQPLGVAFDTSGYLYVTDPGLAPQRIEVFDRSGKLVRRIGMDSNLSFPNGVAVDQTGNVYVTDSNNGRLLAFDATGKPIGQIGRGVGEGNLGLPRGIVVAHGQVLVVDTTGQGVFVYRPQTSTDTRPAYVGSLGGQGISDGQFQFPNGIAADGRGRLYIADSSNDRIQVWSY